MNSLMHTQLLRERHVTTIGHLFDAVELCRSHPDQATYFELTACNTLTRVLLEPPCMASALLLVRVVLERHSERSGHIPPQVDAAYRHLEEQLDLIIAE